MSLLTTADFRRRPLLLEANLLMTHRRHAEALPYLPQGWIQGLNAHIDSSKNGEIGCVEHGGETPSDRSIVRALRCTGFRRPRGGRGPPRSIQAAVTHVCRLTDSLTYLLRRQEFKAASPCFVLTYVAADGSSKTASRRRR